jgi:hypothetical protein
VHFDVAGRQVDFDVVAASEPGRVDGDFAKEVTQFAGITIGVVELRLEGNVEAELGIVVWEVGLAGEGGIVVGGDERKVYVALDVQGNAVQGEGLRRGAEGNGGQCVEIGQRDGRGLAEKLPGFDGGDACGRDRGLGIVGGQRVEATKEDRAAAAGGDNHPRVLAGPGSHGDRRLFPALT